MVDRAPWSRKVTKSMRCWCWTRAEALVQRGARALMLLVLFVAACDDSSRGTAVTFQLTPEQQREMALIKLAETFANHVVAGEYDKAYALTSQRLRDAMDFDTFVAQHEAAIREHGKPLAAHWDMTMPPVTLESEYAGFDESTPIEERAARMGMRMALETHERDPSLLVDWFYCWLNIVQDPAATNDPE